jgi:hypothetical protein
LLGESGSGKRYCTRRAETEKKCGFLVIAIQWKLFKTAQEAALQAIRVQYSVAGVKSKAVIDAMNAASGGQYSTAEWLQRNAEQ